MYAYDANKHKILCIKLLYSIKWIFFAKKLQMIVKKCFADYFRPLFAKFCQFTVSNFFSGQEKLFGTCVDLFDWKFGHMATVVFVCRSLPNPESPKPRLKLGFNIGETYVNLGFRRLRIRAHCLLRVLFYFYVTCLDKSCKKHNEK
jgi:hypothetical protein